jgi:hypothetical protein
MSARTTRCRSFTLVLLAVLTVITETAFAQTAGTPSFGQTPIGVSASGTTTVGFAAAGASDGARAPVDVTAILPKGSMVPSAIGPLVEQIWLASPTFRRQCARLVQAAVPIAIYLDHPLERTGTNATSVITRAQGLRATVHLRPGDRGIVEYLAHEIEHVLEQIDDVDLPLAVSNGVHGASEMRRSGSFETRRAVAIGQLVAREFNSIRNWR